MPLFQDSAKSLFKSALLPAEGSSCPSVEELKAAAEYLRQSGVNLDDESLATEILGSSCGGSLLHQALWLAGADQVPVDHACNVASALLACGANPNACRRGYRPVDMLVMGVRNSTDGVPRIGLLVELLVEHGLSHEVPGKYGVEEMTACLAKEGVPPQVLMLLERGPESVELRCCTQETCARRPRRTL